MKTLDFIKLIPNFINAIEPNQLLFLLVTSYNSDNAGSTNVFNRDTDRFFIIKTWRCKSLLGYIKKRFILRLLDIMDKSHKIDELSDTDAKKLGKQIKKADKSIFKASIMSGTQASSVYW